MKKKLKDSYALPLEHGVICYLDDMALQYVKGLKVKIDELTDRSITAETENGVLKTKVELYEKFIAKMLESDPDKSNDVFMLDGEIYRLCGYEILSEPGKQKTLTAKFRCASDVTHLFKEKS